MGLGGVISHLQSLGTKLLPFVSTSAAQAASSSSSSPSSSSDPIESHEIEADLQRLMKILEGIEARLYDAEERVIRDRSVKLWLKELKKVAYDAEDLLDEYHYEVLRMQVEERDASKSNPRKRKQVQVPHNMFHKIKKIMDRFEEIERDRRDLQLFQEDAPRRVHSELQIAPTSHFIDSNIFGREKEKKDLIDLMLSECHDGSIVSVVTVVGKGGLGKTTLAQLVYNNTQIKEKFDKFGWVCVSEDFNVERITRELVECITKNKCAFINLSALQEELCEAVRGKRVLLVLDDVWNENISLWEKFRAPFRSATLVKILATTRNEPVAQIMQTVPTFKLGTLTEEQCWQLFHHYAFGQANHNEDLVMVRIGKQIIKKCGMLPLAVKSIASLLRHEKEEASWREILESELWESSANEAIFPSLQISYARLPTYLKPCLLYCSTFPKDHTFDLEKLVHLWASHGYIKSNRNNTPRMIGWQYAKQLWQRSFLEGHWEEGEKREFSLTFFCSLHDIVHDLARFSSDNGCYSIEAGKVQDFPKKLYHLYVGDSVKLPEPLPSIQIIALRTLIIKSDPENLFFPFDFLKAQKLRALELEGPSQFCYELDFFCPVNNFKHLRYLSLHKFSFKRLPRSIFFLYNLQTLTLLHCDNLEDLDGIGDLISLQELTIKNCCKIEVLPESLPQLQALKTLAIDECWELEELPTDMGKLTSLQSLLISDTNISCLPHSLSKLAETLQMDVILHCRTIDWLEDFTNLRGNLCLRSLDHISGFTDVQWYPLVSMHNLECLELCWGQYPMGPWEEKIVLFLIIYGDDQNIRPDDPYHVAFYLQPHPNLREIHICCYPDVEFPRWISNPTSCVSLTKLVINCCYKIECLPLGGLCSLQNLSIYCYKKLKSLSGLGKLRYLVEISIEECRNLQLIMDVEPSHVDLMLPTIISPHQNSLLGLRNLTSLKNLKLDSCYKLQMSMDELPPLESCRAEVSYCPGLQEWCLKHNITYEGINIAIGSDSDDEEDEDGDGDGGDGGDDDKDEHGDDVIDNVDNDHCNDNNDEDGNNDNVGRYGYDFDDDGYGGGGYDDDDGDGGGGY